MDMATLAMILILHLDILPINQKNINQAQNIKSTIPTQIVYSKTTFA